MASYYCAACPAGYTTQGPGKRAEIDCNVCATGYCLDKDTKKCSACKSAPSTTPKGGDSGALVAIAVVAALSGVGGFFGALYYYRHKVLPRQQGSNMNVKESKFDDGGSYGRKQYRNDPSGADLINNDMNPNQSNFGSLSKAASIDYLGKPKSVMNTRQQGFASMSGAFMQQPEVVQMRNSMAPFPEQYVAAQPAYVAQPPSVVYSVPVLAEGMPYSPQMVASPNLPLSQSNDNGFTFPIPPVPSKSIGEPSSQLEQKSLPPRPSTSRSLETTEQKKQSNQLREQGPTALEKVLENKDENVMEQRQEEQEQQRYQLQIQAQQQQQQQELQMQQQRQQIQMQQPEQLEGQQPQPQQEHPEEHAHHVEAEADDISQETGTLVFAEQENQLATYPAFTEFNVNDNVRLTRKIGEGGYGILYEGLIVNSQIPILAAEPTHKCAVKILKSALHDPVTGKPLNLTERSAKRSIDTQLTEFKQEVAVIHSLQFCDNIMKFFGCSRLPQLVMVTRLYSMNLSDYLHNPRNVLDLNLAIGFSHDVISAIAAVHHCQFAHLDMKPLNLLVEEMPNRALNYTRQRYRLVLCDFGLARLNCADDPIKGRKQSTQIGLSYRYAGPEGFYIFENQFDAQSGSKAKVRIEVYQSMDVFATAVTINEILSREIPFGPTITYDAVKASIHAGGRPRKLLNFTYDPMQDVKTPLGVLNRIVEGGWLQEWKTRPRASELLEEVKRIIVHQ